ncbi:hypothetical protein SK128_004665 [Halocaridina rubra]|uniref:A-kinase anchor protein 7-like phosphoesterase domain-containing protein n=1 Tax=Halocaridina rubra TaxID=373956 RepID=A0AAN8WYX2_HALRR
MPSHYIYMDLTVEAKKQIEMLQNYMEDSAQELHFEKLHHEYAHITLGVFDLAEDMKTMKFSKLVKTANNISKRILKKAPPISVDLKGLGHFNGRVLFIEVKNTSELSAMRESLMQSFQKRGMSSTRHFHPHVTLFRVKGEKEVDVEKVNEFISTIHVPEFDPIPCNKLFFRQIKNP